MKNIFGLLRICLDKSFFNRFLKKILVFSVFVLILGCSENNKKEWTILVYMAADNSLSSQAIIDINQMEESNFNTKKINLVVQADFSEYEEDSGTYRYKISHDESPEITSIKKSLGELNSGSYLELKKFIDWGKEKYPSEKTALVIWSHGNGWDPKRKQLGLCIDRSNQNSYISVGNGELKEALANEHFDILAFDACDMMTLEVLDEIDESSDFVVASEDEVPSTGFPYDDIMNDWESYTKTENLAISLAKNYSESYSFGGSQNNGYEKRFTISTIKVSKLGNLKEKINFFCDGFPFEKEIDYFENIRNNCEEYIYEENWMSGVDVSEFFMRIEENSEKNFIKSDSLLVEAVSDVNSAITEAFVYSDYNNIQAYFAGLASVWFPTRQYDYENTISKYNKLEFSETNWTLFLEKYFGGKR